MTPPPPPPTSEKVAGFSQDCGSCRQNRFCVDLRVTFCEVPPCPPEEEDGCNNISHTGFSFFFFFFFVPRPILVSVLVSSFFVCDNCAIVMQWCQRPEVLWCVCPCFGLFFTCFLAFFCLCALSSTPKCRLHVHFSSPPTSFILRLSCATSTHFNFVFSLAIFRNPAFCFARLFYDLPRIVRTRHPPPRVAYEGSTLPLEQCRS